MDRGAIRTAVAENIEGVVNTCSRSQNADRPPKKEHMDSRKYLRFKVRGDTYVLLRSSQDERLGFLLDIGSGGLSFEYIPIEGSLNQIDEIDIGFGDKNTCIEKLSCKKIFEIKLEDEYYTPVKMHRVGIEFEDIKTEQLDKLVRIICT